MGKIAAFRPVKRTSHDRAGRTYQTPDGAFPSVTTILSCIGKPALLNWMASEERKYVIAVAAALYEECGEKIPKLSFITALQDRLSKEKAGDRKKQEAANIGSAVHAMVEWELLKDLGQPTPEPTLPNKEAIFAYSQWQEWRKIVELEAIWTEFTVWSKVYGFAGTLDIDCVLRIPKDKELVRKAFRCPSDLSLEAFYQKYAGERVRATADLKTSKAVYWEAKLQVSAYAAAKQEMGHDRSDLGLVIRLPKTKNDPPFEAVPVLNLDEQFRRFLHVIEVWKGQREHDIETGWIKEEAGA